MTDPRALWASFLPTCADHPRLAQWGIEPGELRETPQGEFVLPMRNHDGIVRNLIFIDALGGGWLFTPARARAVGALAIIGKGIREAPCVGLALTCGSAVELRRRLCAPVAVTGTDERLDDAAWTLRRWNASARVVVGPEFGPDAIDFLQSRRYDVEAW